MQSALPSEGRQLGDLSTELPFSGSQLDHLPSELGSENSRLEYWADFVKEIRLALSSSTHPTEKQKMKSKN